MASEIDRLRTLYNRFDTLAASGEDVVADLRKEINNLELTYLKETVFPEVANCIASKVKGLRCSIDCSLQFDGHENINYSFCSSGSMLFIKDTLNFNSILETPTFQNANNKIKETSIRKPENISRPRNLENISNSLNLKVNIIDYSEKAIAVFGDTRELSKDLAQLGGYFNSRLRNGAGWIFSKKKIPELTNFLKSKNITIEFETKAIETTSKKIEPKPDIQTKNEKHYIDLIMAMRCMAFKGLTSPHKAVFLLMVMDGIEKGYITQNKLEPSYKLSKYFIQIWKDYVPSNNAFQSNVFQPFIHLDSEPFYSTIKIPYIGNFDINQAWNLKSVKKYVLFGKFDETLFNLFRNASFRDSLREKIIAKFLNFKKSHWEKSMYQKDKIEDKILLSFRNYLSTRKSLLGTSYSSSTVNVYITSLSNQYIKDKIHIFNETGDLENIKDLTTLGRIIESVISDIRVGQGNTSTLSALKLYKEFLINEISGKNASSQLKNRTNERNKLQPKNISDDAKKIMFETKPLEIKSVKAEHINITSGESDQIFIEFINQIGPELVSAMNINYLGANLVASEPHPHYKESCKRINNEYWVHISNKPLVIANQIIKICNNLNMEATVQLGHRDLSDTLTLKSNRTK